MEDLTRKQEGFVRDYLDTGNATEAVLNNYDITTEGKTKEQIENTAASIGSENLTKPKIIAYLESQAETVASNMVRLALSAESEQVQVQAGRDVLDRAGYKPKERVDHTSGDKPIPLLNALFVNNSDKEDNQPIQED